MSSTIPTRKKRTIIDETIPTSTDSLIEENSSIIFNDTDENLQALLSQYGQSPIRIKLYRIIAGSSPEFCYETSELIDESTIQSMFGGGKYTLRIFVDNQLKKTIPLSIANRPVTSVPASTPLSDPASVEIRMLRENQQVLQNLLISVLSKPVQQPVPTPLHELVEAMRILPLNQNSAPNSIQSSIDLLIKGVDLAKDLGGGSSDWKSELLRTVREIAPAIVEKIPIPSSQASTGLMDTFTLDDQEYQDVIEAGTMNNESLNEEKDTLEPEDVDYNPNYEQIEEMIETAVQDLGNEMGSDFDLYGQREAEEVRSGDGFMSFYDGGYQYLDWANVSYLYGNHRMPTQESDDYIEELYDNVYQEANENAIDGLKDSHPEVYYEMSGDPDLLNYRHLMEVADVYEEAGETEEANRYRGAAEDLDEMIYEIMNEDDSATIYFESRSLYRS